MIANSRTVTRAVLIAACIVCTVVAVCPAVARLSVFVSILPQADFVTRIGGSSVDVAVLVGPGQSPATYEPTPKQMAALGRADVFFRVGTPFERGFIKKIENSYPDITIVDTRRGVPLRYFQRSAGNEVADPHIWLDPKRVKIQAVTVCQALCSAAPEQSLSFVAHLQSFLDELDRLDRSIDEALSGFGGRSFYVFHPAFGYFADSYGMKQVAVEMEGKEPTPRQLAGFIDRAREEGISVIFVQPQFSEKEAQAIAQAIDGVVVTIDPLPRDYIKSMREMARAIEKGLAKKRE